MTAAKCRCAESRRKRARKITAAKPRGHLSLNGRGSARLESPRQVARSALNDCSVGVRAPGTRVPHGVGDTREQTKGRKPGVALSARFVGGKLLLSKAPDGSRYCIVSTCKCGQRIAFLIKIQKNLVAREPMSLYKFGACSTRDSGRKMVCPRTREQKWKSRLLNVLLTVCVD